MPTILRTTLLVFLSALSLSVTAQELDPRRWSHLPKGANLLGGASLITQGDIAFDPVLRIEDAEVDVDTFAIKYIHSFEMFDKSTRVSLTQAQQNGVWSGLLEGIPTQVKRVGLSDTLVRFAVNLKGAPPLSGTEYQEYRSSLDSETIVGLGIAVQIPTGEYFDDKLINLGSNRYTFKPQLGVVHQKGSWAFEATGAVWLYTDNDEFFGGNKLEQDPLFFLQSHIIRNLQPGRWAGLSLGYGIGGETTINGIEKDDRKEDIAWALSYGFNVSPRVNIKLAYTSSWTQVANGLDSNSLVLAISASL